MGLKRGVSTNRITKLPYCVQHCWQVWCSVALIGCLSLRVYRLRSLWVYKSVGFGQFLNDVCPNTGNSSFHYSPIFNDTGLLARTVWLFAPPANLSRHSPIITAGGYLSSISSAFQYICKLHCNSDISIVYELNPYDPVPTLFEVFFAINWKLKVRPLQRWPLIQTLLPSILPLRFIPIHTTSWQNRTIDLKQSSSVERPRALVVRLLFHLLALALVPSSSPPDPAWIRWSRRSKLSHRQPKLLNFR